MSIEVTEPIGNTVERISSTPSQADGYREPSLIQKRIGEVALEKMRMIVNTRWFEGVIRLTNADISALSDEQLAEEIKAADKVIDAISEEECEEIAARYGL